MRYIETTDMMRGGQLHSDLPALQASWTAILRSPTYVLGFCFGLLLVRQRVVIAQSKANIRSVARS